MKRLLLASCGHLLLAAAAMGQTQNVWIDCTTTDETKIANGFGTCPQNDYYCRSTLQSTFRCQSSIWDLVATESTTGVQPNSIGMTELDTEDLPPFTPEFCLQVGLDGEQIGTVVCGDVNDGENLGSGAQWFNTVNPSTQALAFRTITAASGAGTGNCTISQSPTEIEIDCPGVADLPWFDVTDFGATIDDNSNDDAVACNDAMAAAVSAGGGVIYFPGSGVYHFKTTCTVDADNSVVRGNSLATTIHVDAPGITLFDVLNATDTTIRDLTLVEFDSATKAGRGIVVQGSSSAITIFGVRIQDFGAACLEVEGVNNIIVAQSSFDECVGTSGTAIGAVEIRESNAVTFMNNEITNTNDWAALRLASPSASKQTWENIIIAQNTILGVTGTTLGRGQGIWVNNNEGTYDHIAIAHNFIKSAQGQPIIIFPAVGGLAYNTQVINNTILGGGSQVSTAGGTNAGAIEIGPRAAESFISGNVIEDWGINPLQHNGISLKGGANDAVFNEISELAGPGMWGDNSGTTGRCDDGSQCGASDPCGAGSCNIFPNRMVGNRITNAGGIGIQTNQGVSDVTGNVVNGTSSGDCMTHSFGFNMSISGNMLDNCTQECISVSGDRTTVLWNNYCNHANRPWTNTSAGFCDDATTACVLNSNCTGIGGGQCNFEKPSWITNVAFNFANASTGMEDQAHTYHPFGDEIIPDITEAQAFWWGDEDGTTLPRVKFNASTTDPNVTFLAQCDEAAEAGDLYVRVETGSSLETIYICRPNEVAVWVDLGLGGGFDPTANSFTWGDATAAFITNRYQVLSAVDPVTSYGSYTLTNNTCNAGSQTGKTCDIDDDCCPEATGTCAGSCLIQGSTQTFEVFGFSDLAFQPEATMHLRADSNNTGNANGVLFGLDCVAGADGGCLQAGRFMVDAYCQQAGADPNTECRTRERSIAAFQSLQQNKDLASLSWGGGSTRLGMPQVQTFFVAQFPDVLGGLDSTPYGTMRLDANGGVQAAKFADTTAMGVGCQGSVGWNLPTCSCIQTADDAGTERLFGDINCNLLKDVGEEFLDQAGGGGGGGDMTKVVYDVDDNTLVDRAEGTFIQFRMTEAVLRGECVAYTGTVHAGSGLPEAQLAQAGVTGDCSGLADDAVAANGTTRVILSGQLTDLDTTAFADNDELFLSSTVPGGLTTTPTVTEIQFIAIVLRSHASQGQLFVDVATPGNVETRDSLVPSTKQNMVACFAQQSGLIQECDVEPTTDGNLPVWNDTTNIWEFTAARAGSLGTGAVNNTGKILDAAKSDNTVGTQGFVAISTTQPSGVSCAQWDANGRLTEAGAACNSGGGRVTEGCVVDAWNGAGDAPGQDGNCEVFVQDDQVCFDYDSDGAGIESGCGRTAPSGYDIVFDAAGADANLKHETYTFLEFDFSVSDIVEFMQPAVAVSMDEIGFWCSGSPIPPPEITIQDRLGNAIQTAPVTATTGTGNTPFAEFDTKANADLAIGEGLRMTVTTASGDLTVECMLTVSWRE